MQRKPSETQWEHVNLCHRQEPELRIKPGTLELWAGSQNKSTPTAVSLCRVRAALTAASLKKQTKKDLVSSRHLGFILYSKNLTVAACIVIFQMHAAHFNDVMLETSCCLQPYWLVLFRQRCIHLYYIYKYSIYVYISVNNFLLSVLITDEVLNIHSLDVNI